MKRCAPGSAEVVTSAHGHVTIVPSAPAAWDRYERTFIASAPAIGMSTRPADESASRRDRAPSGNPVHPTTRQWAARMLDTARPSDPGSFGGATNRAPIVVSTDASTT